MRNKIRHNKINISQITNKISHNRDKIISNRYNNYNRIRFISKINRKITLLMISLNKIDKTFKVTKLVKNKHQR
jgi:hypothetical protein